MNAAKNYIQKHSSFIFTYLFIITLIGLLFSRAILSISHGVWLLLAIILFDKAKYQQNKQLIFWSIAPLFIFILGAWQAISSKDTYDYLLGLTTYPIAAFSIIAINNKAVEQLKKCWVIIAVASFIIPLFSFFSNISSSIHQYSLGQVVFTPMDTDHVRYSIFIIAALLLVLVQNNFSSKIKNILASIIVLFLLFLAVRTGWLGLLIVAIIFITKQLLQNTKKGLIFLVGFMAIAFVAYFSFPQIKQKINYVVYDWQINKERNYNADYSDAARFSINYLAYNIIQENKSINVGWANIPTLLKTKFQEKNADKKLLFHWPFNQYLFWYLGSGWLGFLLFCVWMIYPLIKGLQQKNYYLFAWQIFIIATCFFECTLSLQFGIFLHAWCIALLWKKN